MEFEIIEDCSPYYIRYRHTGYKKIIHWAKTFKERYIDTDPNLNPKLPFMHVKMPPMIGTQMVDMIYKGKELQLSETRASIFISQPGLYYRPHRDGLAIKMGINYTVDIRDDKCVTSWYDFKDFEGRPVDNLINNSSREIGDYDRAVEKDIIKPIKSMTAKNNEAMLFNTDLYHDVDNTNSPNERTIITFRSSLYEKIDFFAARKLMFGY
jgi:hypothetical protein